LIAVDTSALIAIVLREPMEAACKAALVADPDIIVSAGTLAEALIVANGRKIANELIEFVDQLELEVVAVSQATARQVALAHARWGRGFHPAGLNFGDCFAYVAAMEHGCPLLYVGNDFSKTDVPSAL